MLKPTANILLLTGTIYDREPKLAHKTYVTRPDSRWAATQRSPNGPWELTHRRSGNAISSLLDRTPKTHGEIIQIIERIESLEDLDLSCFDRLPAVTDTTKNPIFFPKDDEPSSALLDDLIRIVRNLPDDAPTPTLFRRAA